MNGGETGSNSKNNICEETDNQPQRSFVSIPRSAPAFPQQTQLAKPACGQARSRLTVQHLLWSARALTVANLSPFGSSASKSGWFGLPLVTGHPAAELSQTSAGFATVEGTSNLPSLPVGRCWGRGGGEMGLASCAGRISICLLS